MVNPADPGDALLCEFTAAAARSSIATAQTDLVAKLCASPQFGATVWQQVASGLLRGGFAPVAVNLLDVAIPRFAGDLELRYWRGNALRLSSRPAQAERDFRDVLDAMPQHRDAAWSLAHLLREQGRCRAASETVLACLRARDDDAEETAATLVFLRECGEHARASAIAKSAHARWPQRADLAALAGEFALALGDFAGARDCLHSALDHDPRNRASWLRLAYCQRFRERDDPDLRRIEIAWRDRSLDAQARIGVGFALGKALDDLGDYATAVEVLREANAGACESTSWSTRRWQRFVEQQCGSHALPQIDPDPGFRPIFVIGLPRTGTTLLARLLARNPGLRERGELNWIDAMFNLLLAQDRLRDPPALAAAATLVTAQMRRDDTDARWYLDKNPLNFRYLNLIAAMFPQARIIHCRRQMRDTALSLWTQHFAHEALGFSFDFARIAAFAHGYAQLMTHWNEHLPLPIFDLEYEALATNPEKTLGEITGFLDLPPPSAQALAQPADTGPITTASVWQARQPLYTRSIGRWEKYAPYLPELERLF